MEELDLSTRPGFEKLRSFLPIQLLSISTLGLASGGGAGAARRGLPTAPRGLFEAEMGQRVLRALYSPSIIHDFLPLDPHQLFLLLLSCTYTM